MKETQQTEKMETNVPVAEQQESSAQEENVTPENVVQALSEDNVIDTEAATDVAVADEPGAETKEVSHANDDNIVEVDDVPRSISNDPYLDFQLVVDFWNNSITKGEDLWREICLVSNQSVLN